MELECRTGQNELVTTLKRNWPNEDKLLEKYADFGTKWFGRHRQRMQRPMSPKEFRKRVRDTNCRDSDELGKTLWVMSFHRVPDIILGESDFGGALTGYAMVVGPHLLYPDEPPSGVSHPEDPYILDHAVMALDGDLDPAESPQTLQFNLATPMQALQAGNDDSTDTNVSTRTADSGDFEDRDPFCFLQIGSLYYCTGEDWDYVRDDHPEEQAAAPWEYTGYGVVVKLNNGHPTGPVYVIYNFHQPRMGVVPPTEKNPLCEEIEWRDIRRIELPHIRRLYPGCNRKFFLAKIANKFEDLKVGAVFDFQIGREKRCPLAITKCVSSYAKIIPHRIATPSSAADKRFRAD